MFEKFIKINSTKVSKEDFYNQPGTQAFLITSGLGVIVTLILGYYLGEKKLNHFLDLYFAFVMFLLAGWLVYSRKLVMHYREWGGFVRVEVKGWCLALISLALCSFGIFLLIRFF